MSTKVSAFMGGLGRDATGKLILQDNATVTIGAAGTGNVLVGATVSIGSNTNPSQADDLIVTGNVRLFGTPAQLVFNDGTTQSTAATTEQEFPTGDFGLLDAANNSSDAFSQTIGGAVTFDMLTQPSGRVAGQDLGAF